MTWKPVRVKKVSDLERIAKAERRVVRAAESYHDMWKKRFGLCDPFEEPYRSLVRAVSALHRARKAKK